MNKITTKKQLRDVPKGDYILIIRKKYSKTILHKRSCPVLMSLRDKVERENPELVRENPDFGTPLSKDAEYNHVKPDEKNILEKYAEKKCPVCFRKD